MAEAAQGLGFRVEVQDVRFLPWLGFIRAEGRTRSEFCHEDLNVLGCIVLMSMSSVK